LQRVKSVRRGHQRALPIAILKESDRIEQFRVLRTLLKLEREGALELHRVMRAVRLIDARAEIGTPLSEGVA